MGFDDTPQCEPVCDTADFLYGPADRRRVKKIWGVVCLFGILLARWRIAAIMERMFYRERQALTYGWQGRHETLRLEG